MALKVVANLVGEDANGPPIRSRLVAHRIHEALVVDDQTIAGPINDSHRVGDIPGPNVEVRLQPGVTCDARQCLPRGGGASEGVDAAIHPAAVKGAVLVQVEFLDLAGNWHGPANRAERKQCAHGKEAVTLEGLPRFVSTSDGACSMTGWRRRLVCMTSFVSVAAGLDFSHLSVLF